MSAIEWTDTTWNPTRGCSRCSPGCDNCYAMRQARRFDNQGGAYEGLTRIGSRGVDWSGKVRLVPEMLDQPLRWRKPRKVFVNSMSDLFHESLPDEAIDQVFGTMVMAEAHTYQILTKRARRMRAYFEAEDVWARIETQARRAHHRNCRACQSADNMGWPRPHLNGVTLKDGPYPHIWVGVSVEDQQRADERIRELIATPAAVRFLSCEPLLGPLDLRYPETLFPGGPQTCCDGHMCGCRGLPIDPPLIHALDWVIVGGESGPGARPCDVAWIRSIVQQCRDAGVPCFVKQLGARPFDSEGRCNAHIASAKDSKGGDSSEWPSDLRVREFPS